MNRFPMFCLLFASGPAFAQAWYFDDVTDDAGAAIGHVLSAGYSGEADMMSGGAAAADVDGDGWIDIFVLRGDSQPAALLHNDGAGGFVERGSEFGLDLLTPLGMPNGAAFGDIDGDARVDLVIGGIDYVGLSGSGRAPLRVFRNAGNAFAETTVGTQLVSDRNVWSAAFGDYDRDGDLDLALGQWTKSAGGSGQLWRNDGTGVFTDVAVASGIATTARGVHPDPAAPPACAGSATIPARNAGTLLQQDFSFTPNFADIDADGWPDLLLAADFCTSRVFRNEGDGSFSDITDASILDENGMGAAVGDYDNDGDLDWFVTSIRDDDGDVGAGAWGVTGNKLYRNDGAGAFTDVAATAGVAGGDWGWGACFADFNNDGRLDLFHVNGMDLPAGAGEDQFWRDPARLFVGGADGVFVEQGALRGVDDRGQGRGVACMDYDRDGDIDLYLNNHRGTGRLLRNEGGNLGGWLGVRLSREQGNRHGIGARIEVTTAGGTQLREIAAGNHFLSSSPAEAHFGLGAASRATVHVTWPDGQGQVFADLPVNRWLTLRAETVFGAGFE